MKDGTFPTPAQVSLFLGEVWLDDAYRIEVRDQNPLIPLYGYAEPEFTNVAQGKRIVQGNIIINYRYPEYLRAAIEGFGKERVEMDRTIALAHDLRNASVNERIALIEDARMKGVGKEVNEVFIEKYVAAAHPLGTEGKDIPSTMRLNPKKALELRIYYDTPQMVNYYTVVEGVRLVGRAMTVSNAAQGGGDASHSGQNLFELYSFFGKRITNRRVVKRSWNVNEYTDRSQLEIRSDPPPEPIPADNPSPIPIRADEPKYPPGAPMWYISSSVSDPTFGQIIDYYMTEAKGVGAVATDTTVRILRRWRMGFNTLFNGISERYWQDSQADLITPADGVRYAYQIMPDDGLAGTELDIANTSLYDGALPHIDIPGLLGLE